ncbi:MAG: thermonuclease family protein [Rhizobiales bacterium]|nr:thermonuclease family protein [Hyphomicrobiales bacterium]
MTRVAAPLAVLAPLAFAALCGGASAGDPIRAIDGDSLAIGAERIRIIGVDAPELKARCPREEELARRAKTVLQALVDRPDVVVERQGRDRYRRTLARVLVGGADVAELLIAAGLGRPYHGEARATWCPQGPRTR